MSRIRILSENLANQIAAGEVIERPASVVKELLENAFDAKAERISIEVEGNGTRLIRVLDDGEGMDSDDLLLCLERHATSKLRDAADLAAIRTLGFRGEAIPSIASVSSLTMTSRPEAQELGARVEVQFGRIMKVHETGCPRGTLVEVRNLFGNLPARRKFLKTAQTELGHIEETLRNYALAYPGIGLTYVANQREVLRLAPHADTLADRVQRLAATPIGKPLIAIQGGAETMAVQGYLLSPDEPGSVAARLRIFVNGRAIRAPMLVHAVTEGLRNFLMKGRGPAGVVFVTVAPESIDVNVHPTKQEVRFHQPQVIYQLVVAAVARAMARHQEELKGQLFAMPPARNQEASGDQGSGQILPRSPTPAPLFVAPTSPLPPVVSAPKSLAPIVPSGRLTVAEPQPEFGPASSEAPLPPSHPPQPDQEGNQVPTRIIGQLLDSYILCEGPEGLVAIDQHAAHERVLFERFKAQFAARAIASQGLLFPQVVELGQADAALLSLHHQEIAGLGFDIAPFGGESYVIKAVPAIMGHVPPQEILAEVLSGLRNAAGEGSAAPTASRADAVLAGLACKAAIKAGTALGQEEMADLLRQMHEAAVFSHCPHGRPVVRRFSKDDIQKWFCRT